MQFINIKAKDIVLTPVLKGYIEKKIGALELFLKRWDSEGSVQVRVEVGRTTRHHNKGVVFRAEANITLPHALLHAEDEDSDLHVAIDRVRDTLKREIQKYRDQKLRTTREARKKAQ